MPRGKGQGPNLKNLAVLRTQGDGREARARGFRTTKQPTLRGRERGGKSQPLVGEEMGPDRPWRAARFGHRDADGKHVPRLWFPHGSSLVRLP